MATEAWKRAAIDISTATTTTIITTAADEFWEIGKLFLWSSGIQGVTLLSQATVLCGKLDMVGQSRFVLDLSSVLWLRGLAVGDDFRITTTAAVQLSGIAVYKLTN
jgi:hypothetical protein